MISKVLITYDLRTPGRDYKDLTDAIQRLGPAQRILESVWVIKTFRNPAEINTLLGKHIDYNDKLFVTQMGAWAQSNLGHDKAHWLFLT